MAAMKKFLIIGNGNAITFKEIFPLIRDNKIWLGVTMTGCQQSVFIVPTTHVDTNTKFRDCDGKSQYSTIINTAAWFTNIDHKRRHEPLDMYKKYTSNEYPKYDNYDAINVNKVCDIPIDYEGVMGVPISFLGKYCPEQFEIIGISNHFEMAGIPYKNNNCYCEINGIRKYVRLFIQKKKINYENMKKFLIIGNMNAITFKEIFPYIKNDELWLGMSMVKEFVQPDKTVKKFGNICWFTNIENKRRNTPLDLYKTYTGHENEYSKYDNYEAINVDKVSDIPIDYDGVMGVPITFLYKYCPNQFEIITMSTMSGVSANFWTFINGKPKFARIYIKHKNLKRKL